MAVEAAHRRNTRCRDGPGWRPSRPWRTSGAVMPDVSWLVPADAEGCRNNAGLLKFQSKRGGALYWRQMFLLAFSFDSSTALRPLVLHSSITRSKSFS